MSNVKSYFEIHAHHHDYSPSPEFYSSVIEPIKSIIPINSHANFLDIGCGNGNFIKALIKANVKANYFAFDMSLKMIERAKENLAGCDVEFLVADGFKIPIKRNIRFNIIHLDSVLHHLIGSTRGKSTSLIEKMLRLLTDKLEDDGILLVQEVYYNSYIISRFTSFVVFYGLKLINLLNLDVSRFMTEIKPGLEVNFLHEKQLKNILNQYGSVHLLEKQPWGRRKLYKLFLLKECGHITVYSRKY
jgi:SAM-dependent methyltransferase